MASNQAHPLSWPQSLPRSASRRRSQFGTHTVVAAVKEIKRNIGLLSGRLPVVSSNIPLRQDGDPYSKPGRMNDPGVAVYFQLKGKSYCMPCDVWQTVEENLWAVAKHIEAMRGMQRWGVGSVEQQFAGFKALPAGENWWDVLECLPTAGADIIEKQYRVRLRGAHPDTGGSHEAMTRLNSARQEALRQTQERS